MMDMWLFSESKLRTKFDTIHLILEIQKYMTVCILFGKRYIKHSWYLQKKD